MASPEDQDGDSQSPGFAMKLAISGISKKFSSVRSISTGTLASWQHRMSPLTTGTQPLTSQTDQGSQFQPVSQGVNQSPESPGKEGPGRLIILDTRPVEEFHVGRIPGSVRVDYEANPDDIATSVQDLTTPDNQTTVVCYCSIGYRSSIVAKKLQEFYLKSGADTPAVFNLEGSIFKWANEGRAMVDGNDRATRYAHPYNAVFGKLLNKELRRTEVEADTSGLPRP